MNYVSNFKISEQTYHVKDEELRTSIKDLHDLFYSRYPFLGVQIDYQNDISKRLGLAHNAISDDEVNFNNLDPYKNRTRCTVADDGTINHFFGEEGYTENGTDGQVMVYQPKFYYRVEPIDAVEQDSGNGYTLNKCNYYISSKKNDNYKLHPAFIDDNGEEVDYYLIGAFEGSLVTPNDLSTVGNTSTGLLSSFSAAINGSSYPDTAYATTSMTISTFESAAQRRGDNWHILTYKILAAEQLLMMIEFGTMNLQGTSNNSALGGGLLASSTAGINFRKNQSTNTGYRLGLGGSTKGTVKTIFNNYTTPIVYRGVENPWGNVNKIINGILYNGVSGEKPSIYMSNTNAYPSPVTAYSSFLPTTNTKGFINKMGYKDDIDWVFLPAIASGNDIGIVGDYYSSSISSSVNVRHKLSLLGYWRINSVTQSGIFSVDFTTTNSASGWNFGTRIVYCPKTTQSSYSANLTKIKSLS